MSTKKKPPASHWNYRIVKHSDKVRVGRRPAKFRRHVWWAIHEAYYTNGVVDGITMEPESPSSDEGANGLIKVLERMLRDAKKSRNAVLKYK